MEKLTLKQFQDKYGIRRIDFSKVHEVDKEGTYGSDKLICPYCGAENEYEAEETDEILNGTPWQCYECEKWFYAEGEVSIDTACTPIENKVLERHIRRHIEGAYAHMDKCADADRTWDKPRDTVEWEIYKQYAEPLFENMEGEDENT